MDGVKRLLQILTICLICAFLALISLRFLGSQMTPSQFQHPLFEERPWIIEWAPNATQLRSLSLKPQLGLATPVFLKDQTWFAGELGEAGIPIEKLLTSLDRSLLLLRIDESYPAKLKDLTDLLKRQGWLKKTLIESIYPLILHEGRKVQPFILYSNDRHSLLKFRLFESLWIETLMPIHGDFLVTDQPSDLSTKVQKELKRRRISLIIDDRKNNLNIPLPEGWSGVITERPEHWSTKVKPSSKSN